MKKNYILLCAIILAARSGTVCANYYYKISDIQSNSVENDYVSIEKISHKPLVAVIDSGFESEELNTFLAKDIGRNSTQTKKQSQDDLSESIVKNNKISHGTHVAGIVAQSADAQWQDNTHMIVPIKVSASRAGDQAFIDAIQHAKKNPNIKVVNLSWKFGSYDKPFSEFLEKEFLELASSGKIIVLAAGNTPDVWGAKEYHKKLISLATKLKGRLLIVGAFDEKTNEITEFSALGSNLIRDYFVMAPGKDIKSCAPIGGNTIKSGTSMAAPYVAGVIQSMLQQNPQLSIDQASCIIRSTSMPKFDKTGRQLNRYGCGIVNPEEAIKKARNASQDKDRVTNSKILFIPPTQEHTQPKTWSKTIVDAVSNSVDSVLTTINSCLSYCKPYAYRFGRFLSFFKG